MATRKPKTLTYKDDDADDSTASYYNWADDNVVVHDALQAIADDEPNVQFDDEESQFLLEHIPEDTDPATRRALERQLTVRKETRRVERARRYSSSEAEEETKRRRRRHSHDSSDEEIRRKPKPEDVKPERKPSPERQRRRSRSPERRSPRSPERRSPERRSEVVYRDREGRKISRDEWLDLREAEKNKRRRKPETNKVSEADLEWGGGLKQRRDADQRRAYEKELAAGPITRHDIDESLDREMRERHRWEDPMASSSRKRRSSATTQTSPMKKSRFPAPPNRFGIEPGSRWDGRIRGNGFEQRFLAAVRGVV